MSCCPDCNANRTVAFSCKACGFCPSCMGRRMVDTAARLTDEILPVVPVRQWVLTSSVIVEMAARATWRTSFVLYLGSIGTSCTRCPLFSTIIRAADRRERETP
ncbi:MAG: hypothetical protein HOC74_26960 [Gemmatimonadetes bacterium]|nr:hypothetical protein [Gemmatimonadota bacterium]MBT4814788.1 hypothetical protein [Lentisphaerota bacterium]